MEHAVTESDLEAIRARLRAATPGPWTLFSEAMYLVVSEPGCGRVMNNDGQWARDADFISAAPTDIAALIAECDRLRGCWEMLHHELEAARIERDCRGGQHTNGPSPKLKNIPPSATNLLKWILREAIGIEL